MSGGNGRLPWKPIGIVGALLAMVISGSLAWSQTKARAEHNTERIVDIEGTLTTIAEQLSRQAGTLERLDERSANTGATQRRILDEIRDLGSELRTRRASP